MSNMTQGEYFLLINDENIIVRKCEGPVDQSKRRASDTFLEVSEDVYKNTYVGWKLLPTFYTEVAVDNEWAESRILELKQKLRDTDDIVINAMEHHLMDEPDDENDVDIEKVHSDRQTWRHEISALKLLK